MLPRRPTALLLSSAALVMGACPGFGDEDPSPGALPTYVEDVRPLFEAPRVGGACTSCHSVVREGAPFRLDHCLPENGVPGAQGVRERVAAVVESEHAGVPAASTEERALFAAWSAAGGDCVPSFDEHVLPIFERHCIACHVGRAGEGDIPEGLRLDKCRPTDVPDESSTAKMLGPEIEEWVVDTREMPPPEEPPLSDAELSRLALWLEQPSLPCDQSEAEARDAGASE